MKIRRRIQGFSGMRHVATDEMQKAAASVAPERAPKDVGERGEVMKADMLQHADGDKCIEPAAHVPAVIVNEFDLACEALMFGPRARDTSCSRETLNAFTRTP